MERVELAPAAQLRKSVRALQNVASVWLMLQQTAAAVLAWVIATAVVGHAEPFFAPMAAVIALNATLGERGINALRLLLGVVVGIGVGEATIALMGRGSGRLAIATFTAMAVARLLNGNRIVIAQAATGAILTVVALEGATVGFERLIDAVVGGAVALVFTQVLFSPEPVRLLRRAESAGLTAVAEILDLSAQALERDDADLAEQTLQRMQEARNQLLEVERTRRASSQVRRHSTAWHSSARASAVEQERARARRLDFLGGSCLMLVRISLSTHGTESRVLAQSIRKLAVTIADLATRLDDQSAHQHAATRALELVQTLFHRGQQPQSALAASCMLLEIVALDFIAFVGVDPKKALESIT